MSNGSGRWRAIAYRGCSPLFCLADASNFLWGFARKYLGDSAKYTAQYEWNREVIGADPDRIVPGIEQKVADSSQNQ